MSRHTGNRLVHQWRVGKNWFPFVGLCCCLLVQRRTLKMQNFQIFASRKMPETEEQSSSPLISLMVHHHMRVTWTQFSLPKCVISISVSISMSQLPQQPPAGQTRFIITHIFFDILLHSDLSWGEGVINQRVGHLSVTSGHKSPSTEASSSASFRSETIGSFLSFNTSTSPSLPPSCREAVG